MSRKIEEAGGFGPVWYRKRSEEYIKRGQPKLVNPSTEA